MPYVIRQLVSNYITEATGRILYLVLAFSKPPNLFAWTRKSFFLRHVLPRIVERRHAAGENRLPRPPENNGAGQWSSMDGTLVAIRAGGGLPQICSGASDGVAKLDWYRARRGRWSPTDREGEDNTRGKWIFASSPQMSGAGPTIYNKHPKY